VSGKIFAKSSLKKTDQPLRGNIHDLPSQFFSSSPAGQSVELLQTHDSGKHIEVPGQRNLGCGHSGKRDIFLLHRVGLPTTSDRFDSDGRRRKKLKTEYWGIRRTSCLKHEALFPFRTNADRLPTKVPKRRYHFFPPVFFSKSAHVIDIAVKTFRRERKKCITYKNVEMRFEDNFIDSSPIGCLS